MPSPVSSLILCQVLQGYDTCKSAYLVNGFRYGFQIGCLSIPAQACRLVTNLRSAFTFPQVIDAKIKKELSLNRILGPYSVLPDVPRFRISPLGVVEKKTPGEYRVIHHLSYPEGTSVNDFIPHEFSTVRYATVQDAIAFIKKSPTIIFLGKVDIESAFRIIPVSPLDRPLLGFQWQGLFYMDAVLPMGCSSSCSIFEAFSSALEWVAKQKLGISGMVHVVDDFLILSESYDKCAADMEVFVELCDRLGVPLAHGKTQGPSTTLPFLGIILDTVNLEARLPQDKLDKCRSLVCEFLLKQKVTLRHLQSLIGLLNHACSVVVYGRGFLRRLIDLTIGVTKPHHHIRLTQQVKLDLRVWQEFLNSFNGRAFFLDEDFLNGNCLELYTDASGSIGYGAVYGKEWFYGTWPLSWHSRNISALELFPIVAAVEVWGSEWANKSVCFRTDNEALVPVINKQTSREPHIMALIRRLVFTCLSFNINFMARHVPGRINILADKLSRGQVDEFRTLAPGANIMPTEIPVHCLPEGSDYNEVTRK